MIYGAIVFLALVVGAYLGLVLPYYIGRFLSKREAKKFMKPMLPVRVDSNRLCKDTHEWIEAVGKDDNTYVPLSVCKKCGFIPSKNMMSTKEGLERILINRQEHEFEESVWQDFTNKEKSDLDKLLEDAQKDGLSQATIDRIYHAGQTVNKRYIIYKIARSEEKRREIKDNV